MTVYELISEAVNGKFLKYYQYIYAISSFKGDRLEGIRIDTNLEYDCIDFEWIGNIEDFCLDELMIIEASDMEIIIDIMCKDLKTKLYEAISKS